VPGSPGACGAGRGSPSTMVAWPNEEMLRHLRRRDDSLTPDRGDSPGPARGSEVSENDRRPIRTCRPIEEQWSCLAGGGRGDDRAAAAALRAKAADLSRMSSRAEKGAVHGGLGNGRSAVMCGGSDGAVNNAGNGHSGRGWAPGWVMREGICLRSGHTR
jgi:hypothetical protein